MSAVLSFVGVVSKRGVAPLICMPLSRQCAVYESGLRDRLMVNFDQTGEVLGVSILPAVGTCTGVSMQVANLTSWKSTIEVVQTVAGPV